MAGSIKATALDKASNTETRDVKWIMKNNPPSLLVRRRRRERKRNEEENLSWSWTENEEKSKKGFEPRKFPQSPDKCYQFHVRWLEIYLRFSLYRTIGTNETWLSRSDKFRSFSIILDRIFRRIFIHLSVKCLLIYCTLMVTYQSETFARREF